MAQLCQHQEDFKSLNTRVLVVSFATLPAVMDWARETCVSFEVLLDRERKVYQAYGMERSALRARSLNTLWTYAKHWLSGGRFHSSHGDDTSQLGGDFIIDTDGLVQLAHRSHDPTDRPSVDYLLNKLRKLQVQEQHSEHTE